MKGLFSSTYFGSVHYYAAILSCKKVLIDAHEPWQKQSYRNRCYIDSPNGRLMLNIPIDHQKSGKTIGSIVLSNDENWRAKHWQALKTTYNLSPFFEEVGPLFQAILLSNESRLLKLNLALGKTVLHCLRVDTELLSLMNGSDSDDPDIHDRDFRNHFHPKTEKMDKQVAYPQVFEHKHGFLQNLSVLDLIFNEGPAAYDYLRAL